MSAHNFWNNFTFGFLNGMFNNNPFGCMNNFNFFPSFNSCFTPVFQSFMPTLTSFSPMLFNSNIMYMTPNVMSQSSFYPYMQTSSPPSIWNMQVNTNQLFSATKWQTNSVSNNYHFNTSGIDTFETTRDEQVTISQSDSTPNQKLTDKYKGSAEQLNKQLNRKNGVLKNKGDVFLAAQEKYGINAAILAAICIHETGYGTSSLARNKNNVGGVSSGKGFKSYNSVDECIMDMARFLKSYYVDKGIVTIADVGRKYCPVGDPRDTKGTNGAWGSAVCSITKRIATLA